MWKQIMFCIKVSQSPAVQKHPLELKNRLQKNSQVSGIKLNTHKLLVSEIINVMHIRMFLRFKYTKKKYFFLAHKNIME